MRHVHHKWRHSVARRSWRDSGRQSSKPLRVGMLDETRKRVATSANWRLQWKRSRTCRTSFDSPAASRCRDPDGSQPQGVYAPRADEEYFEPEILLVASLPGPREPSKDEIEKHNLLHDPAMPLCDICIHSKSRDDFHRQARPKVLPVIQFDYAVAGTQQEQPHFDFMVGTDMSTSTARTFAVLIKGKEDPYIVSSILSWLSELGHSKVIVQSDGEPASEFVMRMVQSKGAMMENPPCEIIQQQSQQYSHQSNGGAERMVQTIRNQIRAYKIQIEKNSGITIKDNSPLLTSLPRHTAWQDTRFHKRQDSTTTAYDKIRHMSYQPNPIRWRGSCVQTTRSIGQHAGISMARRHLAWA